MKIFSQNHELIAPVLPAYEHRGNRHPICLILSALPKSQLVERHREGMGRDRASKASQCMTFSESVICSPTWELPESHPCEFLKRLQEFPSWLSG